MRVVFIERGDFSPGKPLVRPDSNYISSSSFFRAFSPFSLPLLSPFPPSPPHATDRGYELHVTRTISQKFLFRSPEKQTEPNAAINRRRALFCNNEAATRGDNEFSSGECFSPPRSPPPPPFRFLVAGKFRETTDGINREWNYWGNSNGNSMCGIEQSLVSR